MRRCVWSKIPLNEDALVSWGAVLPKTNKQNTNEALGWVSRIPKILTFQNFSMPAFVHPISAFLIRPLLHFLLNCRHWKPPSDFSPLSCHFRKCVTPCYFYRIRHPVPHPYNPTTITVVHKIYCFYILVQSNWRVCCWSHLELLLTISRGLELLPRPARGWGMGVGWGLCAELFDHFAAPQRLYEV
jgi:hypothetical protein